MFYGSIPALVTPFSGNCVDEDSLRGLVEWQVSEGSNGLVPCGTTGESATMSHAEQRRVIEIAVEVAAGRVPVIAGCGSNSVAVAIEHIRAAKEVGADAALVVMGYYNRPSQAGMLAAFRALTAHGRVLPGDWVAVHGCGGVGLSAVMIAVALGARVIAVDVSPAALARARDLGAEVLVDAAQEDDPVATIHRLTGGGALVSLDALGSPATAVASVGSLRPRGRHVQVGLLLGASSTPPLPMDLVVAKELEIYGSHGMAARDYPTMLAMVADKRLRPDLLLGEVIGLEDAGAALAAMDHPPASAGMTVIDMAL